MLTPSAIADALAEGIEREEEALRLEQAVHGIDVRPEVALHPLLAAALEGAGYGVSREERYPSQRGARRRSEGVRCDLVVTPGGLPLRRPDEPATLFDPAEAMELSEAMWLEVKCVPQHLGEGANRRYAAELLRPLRADIAKLAADSAIRRGALVLILFTEGRETALRDLAAWEQRARDRGLDFEPPSIRHVSIIDRVGNRLCTIGVFGVAGRPPAARGSETGE
ncbi:MAG TPA: hypothetical protein PKC43_04580 [Phycisphaerales bacterium]|nr:hypothetical protein [Phycisphaerales bacterium]HMP36703.1 hypothetical protein [Phycisphaerales bacterium]